MVTNKQMIGVADEMADALKKLTDGLAKDGVAVDGFIHALSVQKKWSEIKLKRAFDKIVAKQNQRRVSNG